MLFIIGISWALMMTSIVFILPVTFANKAMATSKEKMLKSICDAFGKENKKFMAFIDVNADLKEEGESEVFDRIKRLNEAYELVNKMPVWPYDISILSRFSATLLFPLLLILLDRLLK